VFDGVINDYSSEQTILLSRTSSPEKPKSIALSGCIVTVIDGDNHQFEFTENLRKPGTYNGTIDTAYLMAGSRFMLSFITPEGKHYISDYEEMLSCPPVDSVYFEIQHLPTSDPEQFVDGVQFYINLHAQENDSRYYRWELVESWEYHSTWPISIYYSAGYHIVSPSDYSKYYCFRTRDVSAFYLLSTENLDENKYDRLPLHFVDNTTQRLLYHYSILVKQFALSKPAYQYWEALAKNNQESGGLYTTQPQVVKGNIYNAENKEERVLGYFGVSSLKEKRIIINEVPGLPFEVEYCDPIKLEDRLDKSSPAEWPIYLVYYTVDDETHARILGKAPPSCFDCTLLNGTTIKPDFFKDVK